MTEPQLADAPANEPVDANIRMLRALPAPVFTVAYGAVLIGLIIGGIVLADTASSHEDAPRASASRCGRSTQWKRAWTTSTPPCALT